MFTTLQRICSNRWNGCMGQQQVPLGYVFDVSQPWKALLFLQYRSFTNSRIHMVFARVVLNTWFSLTLDRFTFFQSLSKIVLMRQLSFQDLDI